jgi:CBS domain containing-hemolysin-like protein
MASALTMPPISESLLPLFQDVQLNAVIAPLGVALVLACLTIASFGSFCANALSYYSPTKLQNRIPGAAGARLVADLERREGEYRIMARFYFLSGLIGAFFAAQQSVDGPTLPWALGALSLAALFACGSVPATVSQLRAERTLLRTIPFLRGGLFLLRWPVILPVLAVTSGILRALRIREEPANNPDELAAEVMAAVADTVTEDKLPVDEQNWIGNIVGLKDLQVSTIMTPRPDLIAFEASVPLQEAVQKALTHGFSRYPVYRERVDEIIGIFFVKDALRAPHDSTAANLPIETMLRPPLFVPESMGVAQLLRRFQADKVHMAIVLDEYGGTAGLVSVEDVLEEIVGDMDDEHDSGTVDAQHAITVVEAGRIVDVSGRTSVAAINQRLGSTILDQGDWETVAGYVIHHLNRIPSRDETFTVDGVEFRILQADDRRISRLRLTATSTAPAERNG